MDSRHLSRQVVLSALFIILSLVMALPAAYAQLTEEWVARFDGYANAYGSARAVATDNAGNVYVTGFSYGSASSDYVTVAYDADGNQLWSATYDGPGHYIDTAMAMAVGPAGNVYVTGNSFTSSTNMDITTVAYDSQGNQLWAAHYDGPAQAYDRAGAIAMGSDGTVYVTGQSRGIGTGDDYATVAYDADGTQLWTARYDGPAHYDDIPSAITVSDAGTIYITGSSYGIGTSEDYATVAYDADGTQLWAARYDGPAQSHDYATAVATDGAGNVYITGRSLATVAGVQLFDFATAAYSADGAQLWVARYDGPAHNHDEASSLAVSPSGDIVVTGTRSDGTNNDYATVAYDAGGTQLWSAGYDGPAHSYDYAKAVVVGPAGNVYVTGDSVSGLSNYDYATVAYDAGGNQLQVLRYDGPAGQNEDPFAMTIDKAGNVYVTGHSFGVGTNYDYATIKYGTDQPAETLTACISAATALQCAGSEGAGVTLDGSCSTGNVVSYGWVGPFGTQTGETSTVMLPPGTSTVTLTVGDGNGGTDSATIDITVDDGTAPVVSAALGGYELFTGFYMEDAQFEMNATDACSGVADVRYILDGQQTIVTGSYAYTDVNSGGDHVIDYDAEDNAGNVSAAGSVAFTVIEANAAGIARLLDYFLDRGAVDVHLAKRLNRLAAKGSYDAFIKQVNIQSGKKIEQAAAQVLISAATYIMGQ